MKLRIYSWNINGFRAAVRKGFLNFLRREKPEIMCVQEIKQHIPPAILGEGLEDYKIYWYPAKRKGYAGTATFSLIEPVDVSYGIGDETADSEGRVITMEFEKFFLINVYFPNAQRGLTRLDYKMKFNEIFLDYIENLRKAKPLVICGDFNVAHKEIDLARPKDNVKNAGFTPEERAFMDKLLSMGYIDTFRYFHPNEPGHYTWWTYRFNARERNIGWRVDYIIISEELKENLIDAFILKDVRGSDHAPIGIILNV
ncbi:MAG: exodeoxyribonuclease III [Candidatus Njordarchaeia archaeon]